MRYAPCFTGDQGADIQRKYEMILELLTRQEFRFTLLARYYYFIGDYASFAEVIRW